MLRPDDAPPAPRVVLLGSRGNKAHPPLLAAWNELGIDTVLVAASELRGGLGPRDVVVGRLDVLPTLDGVEPGLLELLLVERSDIRVVNGARSLVAAHDKLVTARRLQRAGLRHPRTVCIRHTGESPLQPPVVVKPRFGSWGQDVFRCDTRTELRRVLHEVSDRSWFRRHGALVQELIASHGTDVRVVVAGGRVVGAAERVSAPGEWRTNVALGGSIRSYDPPPDACRLAVAAARALDCDFVGVDLLPLQPSGHVVLELNGAVEFRREYSLPGRNVYRDLAQALHLPVARPLPAAIPRRLAG